MLSQTSYNEPALYVIYIHFMCFTETVNVSN